MSQNGQIRPILTRRVNDGFEVERSRSNKVHLLCGWPR